MIQWTKKLPKKEGYYWFTDFFGEPTVLRVKKQNSGEFIALDEEICFVVKKEKNNFWCYISEPLKADEFKKAEKEELNK